METSKLLELTKTLEEIEKTLNKSEGAKEEQMKTLKEMGLASVDAAIKETERLDELIEGLKEDMVSLVCQILEKLSHDICYRHESA